ncbi:MAG: hypothetical protein Kow0099_34350 [Candidatus Abyssubacteria bacterium]
MSRRASILLVSSNPELHRVMELVASTCSFVLRSIESPKAGIMALRSDKPDCAIFDLDTLRNPRQKTVAKEKVKESGIPVLLLNDSPNGDPTAHLAGTPVKLEPIVKFVMDHVERVRKNSTGGFMGRLSGLLRLK